MFVFSIKVVYLFYSIWKYQKLCLFLIISIIIKGVVKITRLPAQQRMCIKCQPVLHNKKENSLFSILFSLLCAKCCNKILIIIITTFIFIFVASFSIFNRQLLSTKLMSFVFKGSLFFPFILQHNPGWTFTVFTPSYIYMTLNWWVALCWVVLQFTKPAGCIRTMLIFMCVFVCVYVCVCVSVHSSKCYRKWALKYPRQCSIIQKSCFIHPFGSLNFMISPFLLIRLPYWLHDPLNIHPFSHSCAICLKICYFKTTFDFLFSIFYLLHIWHSNIIT